MVGVYINPMTSQLTDLVPGGVLSDMQLRFVHEYLIDLNATKAALRAGYSQDSAYSIGSENLRKPEIARALAARREQLAQEMQITQQDVLLKLMQISDQATEGTPVLEFDPEEKRMVKTGEWQFDGKTALGCWVAIAKMLGYLDNKTKPGEGGNGFSLTIVTQAAQLQLKNAGLTIDQQGNIIKIGQNVSRETIGVT